MRLPTSLIASLVFALACGPRPAAAEDARRSLVVLDRGRDAGSTATADAAVALTLVRTLEQRGADVLLLCATADARGRQKVTAPPATPAGIAPLSSEEAFAAAGPTDPRAVLRTALVGQAGDVPIDLYLVGAFSAPTDDGQRSLERALAAWNAKAPPDSRIVPVGVSEAASAPLRDARGMQASGWIVTDFEAPTLDARPFSPLPDADDRVGLARLEARVSVAARVVRVGTAGDPPALLVAATDGPDDVVAGRAVESLHLFELTRRQDDGRTVTISFRPTDTPAVTWLADAPGPLTFTWDRLKPDARLLEGEGAGAVFFGALDAEAGTPVIRTYRLLRTRSGPTPAWRAVGDRLPPGLTWSVGSEVAISPDVAESTVRVQFVARPARPFDAKGTLTLGADGMPAPLSIPYVVRVQPGRARLVAASAALILPPASGDPPMALRIEAGNRNVPATLPLRLRGDAAILATLQGTLREADGRSTAWPLTEPVHVPVGVPLTLTLARAPGATGELDGPCTLTVEAVETKGVAFAGEAEIEVRERTPRLVLAEPLPALRIEDGGVAIVHPIELRLDADGGDGDWLLDLLQRPPVVTDARGGVTAWTVGGREPGVWRVEPLGAWAGREARVFDDRRERVHLTIAWDGGEAPGEIAVPVAVPARWGARGWLFVGLALLALTLGVAAFVLMRVPRVGGTLLYAIEGLEGAVGRLDLGPIGRRRTVVNADARGRLALGGEGEALLRVEPTRVGGMVEVLGGDAPGVRRLLVEGLALTIGRHRLRYLSDAAPEGSTAGVDVPDLLGPEFDIESGRIDALADDGDAPSDSGGPSAI